MSFKGERGDSNGLYTPFSKKQKKKQGRGKREREGNTETAVCITGGRKMATSQNQKGELKKGSSGQKKGQNNSIVPGSGKPSFIDRLVYRGLEMGTARQL